MRESKAVRWNLLTCSIIFLNFWYLLLVKQTHSPTVLILLNTFTPLITFALPMFVFVWIGAKHEKLTVLGYSKDCFCVKKTSGKNLAFSVALGVTLYFAYVYLYSAAVCFNEYTTGVIVYHVPQVFDWRLLGAILFSGAAVPFLSELVFRGGGKEAYGGTALQYIAPVLFGIMTSFSTDGWIKAITLGVMGICILRQTNSALPSAICAAVFSLLSVTLGNYVSFPLSFQTASSVETALLYGLFSAAIGVFALGVTSVLTMLLKGREKEAKRKLSLDDKITAVAVCAVYVVLLLVSAML